MKSTTVFDELELNKIIDEVTAMRNDFQDAKIIVSDQKNENYRVVFLSNYVFWATHYEELREWSQQYSGIKVRGMTVQIDSEELLTVFLLKWS